MSPDLVVLHLGALHPVEKVLTLLLAFGPFVVLGAVVMLRRGLQDEPASVVEDEPALVAEGAQRDR